MTLKDLERILYFEYYVVLEPGLTPLKDRQLLSEDEYLKAQEEFGADSFTATIGAEAIREMLKALDLDKMQAELRVAITETDSDIKKKKFGKRLKLIEAFIASGNKPEWMILTRRAGDPARSAAAGAARRRPLCHVRPQRSLSPRHQPQQPPEAADRAARAGHHHPQRKAHAAGSGRCAVRQRPPRPRHHRRQQAPVEVARRHAQGQAGPLPAEPARQARRLFRPLGHRGRSRTQAASVRPAEEDGARTVQAVHLFAARRQGSVHHGEAGQEAGRKGEAGGLGHPRRGDPRASGAAQPRADAASPRHPGFRAGADRGQGDPAASAGVRRLQRRLRRRPDGRARPAVARSAAGSARADDVDQQHSASGERPADHRAVAGHRARALLPHAAARGRAGREQGLRRHGRDRACAACQGASPAHQDPVSLGRRRRKGQAVSEMVRDHARPRHARQCAAAQRQSAVRHRQQADDQARNLRR